MKTKKENDFSYTIKKNDILYSLSVSAEGNLIKFLLKEPKSDSESISYFSSFTIGNLIDIDQRFRAFFIIDQLFQDIKATLEKNIVDIQNTNEQVVLVFPTMGNPLNIPLRLESSQALNYEEEIKKLNLEIEQLKSKIKESESKIPRQVSANQLTKGPCSVQKQSGANSRLASKPKKRRGHSHFDPERTVIKKYIEDKTGYITSLCLLKDGRFAAASSDKTIKIFNQNTFKCELMVKDFSSPVIFISVLDNRNLVSSSRKEIKIFEVKKDSYKCIETLNGHQGNVNKVIQISSNRFCSCSADKTIRIWNSTSPYECIKILEGALNNINSVIELKNKRYIVSGESGSLGFWNDKTYECEKLVKNVYCSWSSSLVEVEGDRLIVGGNDGVAIVNSENYRVERVIKDPSLSHVYSMIILDDETLLCGCKSKENEGSFVNLDIPKHKVLSRKIGVHDSYIFTLLKLPDNSFISGSFDKNIKVWEY